MGNYLLYLLIHYKIIYFLSVTGDLLLDHLENGNNFLLKLMKNNSEKFPTIVTIHSNSYKSINLKLKGSLYGHNRTLCVRFAWDFNQRRPNKTQTNAIVPFKAFLTN